MKLKVQIVKKSDSRNSEGGNGLILTFKDYKNTVKIKTEVVGEEEEEEEIVISFIKNTNPEFVIDGDDEDNSILLAKKWDKEVFEKLLGLECGFEEGNNPLECTFTESSEEINLGKGTGDDFEKLTIDDTKGKNFKIHKDIENFNQGFKFVYSGTTVPEQGDSGVSLEQNGEYEFKLKAQKGKPREYYLAKKAK